MEEKGKDIVILQGYCPHWVSLSSGGRASMGQWKKSISGYLSGLDRVLCRSFVVIVWVVSPVTMVL